MAAIPFAMACATMCAVCFSFANPLCQWLCQLVGGTTCNRGVGQLVTDLSISGIEGLLAKCDALP